MSEHNVVEHGITVKCALEEGMKAIDDALAYFMSAADMGDHKGNIFQQSTYLLLRGMEIMVEEDSRDHDNAKGVL